VGGVFGMPIRVDWIPQPIERACYRTEYSWTGPTGTAARLASALKGWQRVRFEVTEEGTSSTEGDRYSYTPTLGIFHATVGIHGDIMIPEDRIKHAIAVSALSGMAMVLAQAGHSDQALTLFNRVLTINPQVPMALLFKGRILYEDKKDYAAAIASWEQFLRVMPQGGPADVVRGWIEEARREARKVDPTELLNGGKPC